MRGRIARLVKHPLSPFKRRTLFSIIIVIIVLSVGTEGIVLLEGWSYVDAFYFISLIATTQGPTRIPVTDAGKIFTAIMAFISVGAVLSAAAFVFGPLVGTLLKDGFDYLQKEEQRLKGRLEHETPDSEAREGKQ